MHTRTKVEIAKAQFVFAAEEREWLRAVGIAKIQGSLGLMVSVRPGAKPAASRLINRLELGVPVSIQVVEEVYARTPQKPQPDPPSIDALKAAALSRFKKKH